MPTAVIYDLEFTAWEGSMRHRWLRPGEFREVVQIGAVKVDARTLELCGRFDVLVKPRINPIISPYFERLTGITSDEVRGRGLDFADAFARFLAFADGTACSAFGRDEIVIAENMRLYGLAPPIAPPDWRDSRPWFRANGIDTRGLHSCEIGPTLGVPFEGQAHNALADSLSVVAGMRALVARGARSPFADLVPAAKTAA